ncbi:MAG: sulfotransferase [Actinomycetota bacterium]|nr:sulfotransferase [Actinomycetota bacterium]
MRPDDDPGEAKARARPRIVFVGGTGRSGTHILATLISQHRRYAFVPVESRFHVNPQGLADLLAGEAEPLQFVRKLRRFWWHRIPAGAPLPAVLPKVPLGRGTRGLHSAVSRDTFESAVARFEAALDTEPLEVSCRRLFLDLLWPIADEQGKPGLVEMSTHTVARAPELARLFPDAKLIHIVRDGRDAGSSKVSKRQRKHHPRNVAQGVAWWRERIERAERSLARAPEGFVLPLSLDELVAGEREAEFEKLVRFLRIEKPGGLRRFFDRRMSPENASRGRWRAGLSEAEQRSVNEAYEQAIAGLEAKGYPSGAILRRVYERFG